MDPCIVFSHRPDPEGMAKEVKVYMEAAQATALADAVMALLNEIHHRRNPELAGVDEQAGLLASALFDVGENDNQDNPMFETENDDDEADV